MSETVKEKSELHNIPCNTCLHNRVCTVRKQFEETEVRTTHPYIKVTLECTEWLCEAILTRGVKNEAIL